MIALALAVALAAMGADEVTSLETETAEQGWARSGFRLALGYEIEDLIGVGGTPSGIVHSAVLRAGGRIDQDWSLLGSLRYGVRPGETTGLRFGATIDPTLHIWEGLTASIGIGIGGFVMSTGAPTPMSDVPSPFTVIGTDPLLGSCSGAGLLAVARIEYAFIVGSVLSTGPSLTLDAQWTRCIQSLQRTDPDTGEAIELRQFWQHHAISLGWTFWWR